MSAQVVGNDATLTLAGQGGYFELNTMMPVAAYNILQSIALLSNSCGNLATQCIDGIVATNTGPEMVERGLMLGTALAPAIGYDAAAVIAKEAAYTGRTIREGAKEKTDLTEEALIELLNPEEALKLGSVSSLVMPGYSRKVLGNALLYLLRHYHPEPLSGPQRE